jgi:predicted kinase
MASHKLIVVGGSPATGKTTLSKFLGDQTGIKRISMDDLKELFFDWGGYRDREWSKEIGRLAWPVFKKIVEMHLAQGESVIAEATFLWSDDALWVEEIASKHGAEIVQIWMTADPKVARERFIKRANTHRHPGHNDALEYVIEEFDKRFFCKQHADPLPVSGKTKIVDTTDLNAVNHEEILRWIQ